MKKITAILLTFSAGLNVFAAELEVSVTNMRTTEGTVLISIFNDAEAFPEDTERAVKNLRLTTRQAARFIVEGLPYGEYAIAMAHDENNNGKIDKNGMGIPKEGFGFSNNAMGTFGPPSFKKAKIVLNAPTVRTGIKTKYF